MPKSDKRYIVLFTPNGKQTDVKVVQLKQEKIELDEMYKLIGCRCISVGRLYKEVDERILKSHPLAVFDDEFLLTEETPIVNYAASILVGYTLCGKVLVVKDDGEEMVPFSLKEATNIFNYALGVNSLADMFEEIEVPKPKFSVKPFETLEDLQAIMKEE